MSRPRKYKPGAVITDPVQAIHALLHARWLFVRGKVYHPAFLLAWPVTMIANHCKWGHVQVAEINPEWTPKMEAEA